MKSIRISGAVIVAVVVLNVAGISAKLKLVELLAPYKIQNMGNGRYLTASEQGILGLKTGAVTTQPFINRKEQQWTLIWDPSLDDNFDGYRLESKVDYLNQVTTFYPDGSTIAVPNIWEVIQLRGGGRMFRNKRTRRCLQIQSSKVDVVERTCSIQNRFQHWQIQLLDLDKRIGEKKRFLVRKFVRVPVRRPEPKEEEEGEEEGEEEEELEDEHIELDNSQELLELEDD